MTVIAVPLFAVLNWIHGWVGNWGIAIILLTVLIKLIFYPLQEASYKAMAKMKVIAPKMQALFSNVFRAGYDAVAFMLDCPPADRSDTSAFDGPIRRAQAIGVTNRLASGDPSVAVGQGGLDRGTIARKQHTVVQGQQQIVVGMAAAGDGGDVDTHGCDGVG